jgi:hypothetical protein
MCGLFLLFCSSGATRSFRSSTNEQQQFGIFKIPEKIPAEEDWEPDYKHSVCMICKEVAFNMVCISRKDRYSFFAKVCIFSEFSIFLYEEPLSVIVGGRDNTCQRFLIKNAENSRNSGGNGNFCGGKCSCPKKYGQAFFINKFLCLYVCP